MDFQHDVKALFAGMLLLGITATASWGQGNPPPTLIWADEFDGSSLDLSKWEPMIGNGQAYGIAGWGNNELQYYTDRSQNITVNNGTLTITARQENFAGYNYTSARLRTLNKGEFLYGRIEARLKLPSTQGIWPAFWMLPTNSIYGGWAAGGEIDIMEKINTSSTIHGTLHFGDQWPGNTSAGGSFDPGVDLFNEFHTYAIEWDETDIYWFFDGVPFGRLQSSQWWSANGLGDPNAPFDQQFHMLLNVAVGGNWPGNPNGSSEFPQTMEVDYVRVYSYLDEPVAQQPYSEAAPIIPARIQMEEFDLGGPGVSYFDSDAANLGGAFRPTEGVDIEDTAGGGYNIGYIEANEWAEYTVNFPRAGTYDVRARFASNGLGGEFGFSLDGQSVGDTMTGFSTGGWQNWTLFGGQIVVESAGEHVLRWENRSGDGFEYNLDWFEVYPPVFGLAEPVTLLDNGDIQAFIGAFLGGDMTADFNGDDILDNADIAAFVNEYLAWVS